jgi:23S rRNA pseudouridine1911/1915/1917 synthase
MLGSLLNAVRLDLALIRLHPGLSRRRARAAIEKGQVTVDGERAREPGREVPPTAAVRWDPNLKALPRARSSLPVLYEDEHVLVLDKPAGLLSVPTPGAPAGEDSVLARARDYAARRSGSEARRVHRLDRDTSGALAFALTREARAALIRAFREHRIERLYLALVAPPPREDRGIVDLPLRDSWQGGRRGVARPGEASKPALTRWRVRARYSGAALLEVLLGTGRQHQIRVHLAHAGMPVVGDRIYGGGKGPRASRPMLHAASLRFAHPVSGAEVSVASALPADFERALSALRERPGGTGRRHAGRRRGR